MLKEEKKTKRKKKHYTFKHDRLSVQYLPRSQHLDPSYASLINPRTPEAL